MNNLTQEKTPE